MIMTWASLSSQAACVDWFRKIGLSSRTPSCLTDCAIADVDMSSFNCPNQCDDLCWPKISIPIDCKKPQASLSCQFYDDCLENIFTCGSQGYPVKYGKKYCEKFLAISQKNEKEGGLSSEGIKWRNKTLLCLQNILVETLNGDQNKITCNSIKSTAFNSHADCYTHNGQSICSLSRSDILEIILTPDSEDLFSNESLKQSFEVGTRCLKTWLLGEQNLINLGTLNYESNIELSSSQDKLQVFSELISHNKLMITMSKSLSKSKKADALRLLEQMNTNLVNLIKIDSELNSIESKESKNLVIQNIRNLSIQIYELFPKE